MVTVVCTLTFPDGQTVTGMVRAASHCDENEVIYTGAIDRLPRRFDKAAVSLLQCLFKNRARETGAALSSELTGIYDDPPE